jgi:hypothetical protein
MNTGGLGDCDDKLDSMLPVLPLHRDAKGAWHRFPFFFTLLEPKDVYSERKIAVLERVLDACG